MFAYHQFHRTRCQDKFRCLFWAYTSYSQFKPNRKNCQVDLGGAIMCDTLFNLIFSKSTFLLSARLCCSFFKAIYLSRGMQIALAHLNTHTLPAHRLSESTHLLLSPYYFAIIYLKTAILKYRRLRTSSRGRGLRTSRQRISFH